MPEYDCKWSASKKNKKKIHFANVMSLKTMEIRFAFLNLSKANITLRLAQHWFARTYSWHRQHDQARAPLKARDVCFGVGYVFQPPAAAAAAWSILYIYMRCLESVPQLNWPTGANKSMTLSEKERSFRFELLIFQEPILSSFYFLFFFFMSLLFCLLLLPPRRSF